MQKWCPEPFTVDAAPAGASGFEPTSTAPPAAAGHVIEGVRFRAESGFSTPEALMSHLTREERRTVFELVEIDVAREYQEREQRLTEGFEQKLDEARRSFQDWAEEFSRKMDQELRDISAASVQLARQMAERIVRQRVEMDSGVLVRAIETALFRIQGGQPLTVTVNPADAEWLEAEPDLLDKLNIGLVAKDRRIAQGGCLIDSGNRQWDATLAGQLDTFAEIIQELLEAQPTETTPPEPDADGAASNEDLE